MLRYLVPVVVKMERDPFGVALIEIELIDRYHDNSKIVYIDIDEHISKDRLTVSVGGAKRASPRREVVIDMSTGEIVE
jgi:hypothetical protein